MNKHNGVIEIEDVKYIYIINTVFDNFSSNWFVGGLAIEFNENLYIRNCTFRNGKSKT